MTHHTMSERSYHGATSRSRTKREKEREMFYLTTHSTPEQKETSNN